MLRKVISCGIMLVCWQLGAQQKTDSVLQFSLQEAKEYAIKNSPVIKNAELSLTAAKRKIWETTAIGLPQVSAKGSYSYMIEMPAMIESFAGFYQLPNALYGYGKNLEALNNTVAQMNPFYAPVAQKFDYSKLEKPSGEVPELDDYRKTQTLDVTVSQLIFSGAYFVGLQTSRAFKGLSALSLTKSKVDLIESITNSYYLVLIARENKAILDSMLILMEDQLRQVKAMQQQGFVEDINPDQIQLVVNNLHSSTAMLERQITIAENLLKFQMGVDLSVQVVLTDKLSGLAETIPVVSSVADFVLENNIEYRLLSTQEKLMKLNLRYEKTKLMPEIAAFYNYEKNFNENSFTFTPPQMIGVSINIPIFGSGMKLARISQAKIQYEQARNTKENLGRGLQVSYEEAKSNYLVALDKYNNEKINLALAEKIYRRTLIKYTEGVATSLELTQAQNQYLTTQQSYFSAILSFASAKAKLEKLLSVN